LDRILAEVDNFCRVFPDWGERTHFLDPVTAGFTMAIIYDWLYYDLTEEYRQLLRETMIERTIMPGLAAHAGSAQGWWTRSTHNWNTVCNAGLIVTSIALINVVPDLSKRLISESIRSIEHMLPTFAPDGGWYEGPAYWQYNAEWYAKLLAALYSAFGTDYGYMYAQGVDRTAFFPIHMGGPNLTFMVHSTPTNMSLVTTPAIHFFARQLGDGDLGRIALDRDIDLGVRGGIRELLWVDFDNLSDDVDGLPLDYMARVIDVATFRTAWNDTEAMFAGLHWGANNVNHGHLDAGEFVLDALGERWAIGLGDDRTTLPGFYGNLRWHYFRHRAEGHNTIVTNPRFEYDQHIDGYGVLERFESKPKGGLAITDISAALIGVDQARRGLYFDRQNQQVIVQDEIRGNGYEFYWFMQTRAAIDISADGRTAYLRIRDNTMRVDLLSDAPATFSVLDAAPLPHSPNPPGQNPNFGYRRLTIHIPRARNMTISVVFTPITDDNADDAARIGRRQVIPLDRWEIPDGELPRLSLNSLTINGEQPQTFTPNRRSYLVHLPFGTTEIPEVIATSDYSVRVIPTDSLPGTTRIAVTDNNGNRVDYTVNFAVLPQIGRDDTIPQIRPTIFGFSSQESEHGNVAQNAIDGNLNTRWTSEGFGEWLALDLGTAQPVTAIGLAFFRGDSRQYFFEIQISLDGENWETIYAGNSSGTTNEEEFIPLPEVMARYIRYIGLANSENQFNNITSWTVYTR